ncbi:MAG: FlgD immunoglobulin-like domain containing protein [Candidatus Eisenbacteria bacterium]
MRRLVALLVFLSVLSITSASAQLLFSDDFEAGARPEWGNEYGAWIASNGVYSASLPNNDPPTYSSVTSLPDLTDFVVEIDILDTRDGGVFLRSRRCANEQIEGVLFLVGGFGGSYHGCYWHIWTCTGSGPPLQTVEVPGLQGNDIHIRLVVTGDTYTAYLNDDPTPVNSLVTDAYSSGKVALYEFVDQSFDNVTITGVATGVHEGTVPPRARQCSLYPNPFNPSASVWLDLPRAEFIRVEVFNTIGRLVATLHEGVTGPGRVEIPWDGRSDIGTRASSGIYYFRASGTTDQTVVKGVLSR